MQQSKLSLVFAVIILFGTSLASADNMVITDGSSSTIIVNSQATQEGIFNYIPNETVSVSGSSSSSTDGITETVLEKSKRFWYFIIPLFLILVAIFIYRNRKKIEKEEDELIANIVQEEQHEKK